MRNDADSYSNLISFLRNNSCDKIIILAHEQADLDSYASCWGLKELLSRFGFKSLVYLPSITLELKHAIETMQFPLFNHDKEEAEEIDNACVILVDFSDIGRLETRRIAERVKRAKKIAVIDHHKHAKVMRNTEYVLFKPYNATAEIVTELIYEMGLEEILEENKKLATSLIGGILVDTSFLERANSRTFYLISLLAKYGDYSKMLNTLKKVPRSLSERIALLKGAQRSRIIRINNHLIAFTHIGSYESSVASSLIKLGADIAIVLSKKQKRVRIVGRSKISIDLGEIFSKAVEDYQGKVGGHPGAAVVDVELQDKKELNSILNRLQELIVKSIKDLE